MADYRVLGAADETLRTLLWSQMQFDSEISSIITSEQQISFEPPFKLVIDTEPLEDGLSMFLYRIVEDADMKNRPLLRTNGNRQRYPPLALSLFYLITPLIIVCSARRCTFFTITRSFEDLSFRAFSQIPPKSSASFSIP
jgi:hypothetical protein